MKREEAIRTLELGANPTEVEVKSARTKLSLRFHEDRHQGSNDVAKELLRQKFRDIQNAATSLLAGGPGADGTDVPEPTARPIDGDDVLAQIALARVLEDWGAVIVLSLELALYSGFEGPARRHLADALVRTGQFSQAASVAKKATLDDGADHESWFFLAVAKFHLNDLKTAQAAVDMALRRAKSPPPEYRQLRDILNARVAATKPIGSRVEDLLNDRCSACGSAEGFKEGRCKACGFRSPVRTVVGQAARAVGKFLSEPPKKLQPRPDPIPEWIGMMLAAAVLVVCLTSLIYWLVDFLGR